MLQNNGRIRHALLCGLPSSASALAGLLALCCATAGCGVGSVDPTMQPGGDGSGGSSAASGGSSSTGTTIGPDFTLRAEFSGPCTRADIVDANLGNSAESFVRAAFCQVNGSEPSADAVSSWAAKLKASSHDANGAPVSDASGAPLAEVRRIDVVQQLCMDAGRTCAFGAFSYSDPWLTQPDLMAPCTRSGTRDVGAVLMFFNHCPGNTNCQMWWANTHAEGMTGVSPLLSFAPTTSGAYAPENPGFWRRELLDAAYAGVQFFLLNTYGPDLSASVDPLAQLGKALDETKGAVKIGLFDDTSGWGTSGAFSSLPDLSNSSAAAQAIYTAKWKPFFSRVPQKYWYLVNGRPLVYFYNAGNLKNPQTSTGTVTALSALFKADFGVAPFISVDDGYYDSTMNTVADARFHWNPLTCRTNAFGSCVAGEQMSESNLNGVKFDHFMVKWDPIGRSTNGRDTRCLVPLVNNVCPTPVPPIALASDGLYKDDTLLKQRLIDSASAQIAVIATWNDMGEGTGIARNYDYYAGGNWLEPDAFIKDIRASQCSN
jgi:hypothetical protein